MLDFGLFEIRTDIFILILSVLTVIVQLFLCAKIKKLIIRLIPTIVLATVTVVFTILIFVFDGWDSVGFLLLAVWTAFLLGACGAAWALWWLLTKLKKK